MAKLSLSVSIEHKAFLSWTLMCLIWSGCFFKWRACLSADRATVGVPAEPCLWWTWALVISGLFLIHQTTCIHLSNDVSQMVECLTQCDVILNQNFVTNVLTTTNSLWFWATCINYLYIWVCMYNLEYLWSRHNYLPDVHPILLAKIQEGCLLYNYSIQKNNGLIKVLKVLN